MRVPILNMNSVYKEKFKMLQNLKADRTNTLDRSRA